MTGPAGHLASHSAYGSLIAPGVLLRGERKTPVSPERKSCSGSVERREERGLTARSPAGSRRAFTCQPGLSRRRPSEPAPGESSPRHPIPKKESQPQGCCSRRGPWATARSERRHATRAPHLPDNPCAETPQLSGDQTSGSIKHPEWLRTRKKKKKAASRAASEQLLKKPATAKIAESSRGAEDYTRGAAIGREGGQKERSALIGRSAYKRQVPGGWPQRSAGACRVLVPV